MSNLYVIRDNLAGSIVGPVQSMKHDAVAVRFFQDVASQPGTSINQHIEQHDLLCIAEMDDDTGDVYLQPATVPVIVITGAALVAMREAQENKK